MTEEGDGESSWAGCGGCGIVLLVTALMVFGVSYTDERRFDPDDRCAEGTRDRCVRSVTGTVEKAGGFFDEVTVSYGDGRWRAVATMAGTEEPPVGRRVRLEWWEGKLIALVDRKTERRYKTIAWPNRWDEGSVVALLVLAAVAFAIGGAGYVKERRSYAARSNGKP